MPTLTLLDDAMLRPGRMVPAVNRLGGGTVAMTGSTQPWRVVGTSAVVYQLRQPTGRVLALRCFLDDELEPTLGDRYRGLSGEPGLRRLRTLPHSPIVGNLAYIAEGLTFPTSDFRSIHLPVVAMDWVMGPTLIAAADRACRAGDRAYLAALAAAWLTTVDALTESEFAHGNLTGDNAMVRAREGIALVDYDTATWPGSPKPPGPEQLPGYRHPRGVASRPERRDDFTALMVYASLRVLTQWPDLREEHGDPPSKLGGVLLFSPKDLAAPDSSRLFGKLRVVDDPEVQALIGILREACLVKVDDVPPFREAVDAAVHVARSVPSNRPNAGFDPRDRQQRLTRLNSLLLAGDEEAARRFWRSSGLHDDPEAARELGARMAELERQRALREARRAAEAGDSTAVVSAWERERLADHPSAVPMRPIFETAKRRAGAVEQLKAAIESGDAAAVGALWPEVRGDPAASAYAIQATEILSKLLGAAIAGAIERGDDAATVAAVRDAEAQGIAVGVTARRAARAAARRLKVRRQLEAALRDDDRETLASLALGGQLEELGRLPESTMRAVVRAIHWPLLMRALAGDDDRAISLAFDPDVFENATGLTDEDRHRIDLALRRIRWLDVVRRAIRQRDVPTLRVALEDIPDGADRRLSRVERDRITRLTTRDRAIALLTEAMRTGDDIAIVDALNELEVAGATLPEGLDWQAVRGVVDRLSLAAAIRRAALAKPPDYARLARLLPAARDASGGETPYLGSNLDFVQLESDVTRAAARSRLREAIARADEVAIVAAAVPDLYGTIPTLTPDERKVVERAVANQRGMDPLKKAAMSVAPTP
ncbi:MAG: hypothetical protein QOG89_2215 [Thermomicrobiales bacterium]|nr:hypothetical protein [Thermomicrobiales bacterium]